MSWWQTIAVALIASLGTYTAARITARSSDRAADKTAAVQARTVELDGMDRLVHNLEARLNRVEQEAREALDRNLRLTQRVETLEDNLRDTRALLRDTRTLFNMLVEYTRLLRQILAASGVRVPAPPDALHAHLEGEGISADA